MKVSTLVVVIAIQGLLLTTRVNGCELYDLDFGNDEDCKHSHFDISDQVPLAQFESLNLNGLVFGSIELVINKIKSELEKEHERRLVKNKKSLSYVDGISLDERINSYLANIHFLGGEEIKQGVLEIIENYQKHDKGNKLDSKNRIIHSELLENNYKIPPNQGFINLVLFPNENI